MRPTVQGGALLRCRRFSIEGRMMRMTRGWLSLLMLVSASAQAADLAVTRVESSVFVRHANGDHAALSNRDPLQAGDTVSTGAQGHVRSEEHTSELQSLMRISYAVFCLQKKR